MKSNTHPLSVYVYNSVEDEWRFQTGISDAKKREKSIHSSDKYGDCYLFTQVDTKQFVFISPVLPSPSFIRYFEDLTKTTVVPLSPKRISHSISRNIVKDDAVFSRLLSLAAQAKKIILTSYASTPELYELKTALEKKGISVTLPLSPEKNKLKQAKQYGTKSGLKQCIRNINTKLKTPIAIPEGQTFRSMEKAATYAASLYRKNKQVVIKTDNGYAGAGVLIYKENDLSFDDCEKQIVDVLKQNDYWKNNPIVVEEFIRTNAKFPSNFPSIEYLIDRGGKIHMLYYCNMIVTEEGEFYGMEMHENSVEPSIKKELLKTKHIAHVFADNGYRGHFDIDTIVSEEKKLYINETNLRNTGGTDTFYIVKKLIGSQFFSKRYVVSRYMDLPFSSPEKCSFEYVYALLKPLLFSPKNKCGIVISSESVIRNKGLSYAVIAKDRTDAIAMEKRMRQLLLSK